MRGLDPRIHLSKRMDCRVKPGNDDLNWIIPCEKGLTSARRIAISTAPGTTSGHLALDWA
jgi:hypothetical protein